MKSKVLFLLPLMILGCITSCSNNQSNLVLNEEYYTFSMDITPKRHENFYLFTEDYLISWGSVYNGTSNVSAYTYKKSGNSLSIGSYAVAYYKNAVYENKKSVISELTKQATESKKEDYNATNVYYAPEKGRLEYVNRNGSISVMMTASYAEKLGKRFYGESN